MRALEKDRRRRYQTADALAADIRRYLAGEAVQARPAGNLYKAHKFVARNRVLVGSALAIAIALLAGLAVSSIGFYRAARDRDRAIAAESEQSRLLAAADAARLDAEHSAKSALAAQKTESAARALASRAASRAESLLEFSDLMIGSADPDVTSTATTTTREMLDRAADRVGEYFTNQPEAEFLIRSRIGRPDQDIRVLLRLLVCKYRARRRCKDRSASPGLQRHEVRAGNNGPRGLARRPIHA